MEPALIAALCCLLFGVMMAMGLAYLDRIATALERLVAQNEANKLMAPHGIMITPTNCNE